MVAAPSVRLRPQASRQVRYNPYGYDLFQDTANHDLLQDSWQLRLQRRSSRIPRELKDGCTCRPRRMHSIGLHHANCARLQSMSVFPVMRPVASIIRDFPNNSDQFPDHHGCC